MRFVQKNALLYAVRWTDDITDITPASVPLSPTGPLPGPSARRTATTVAASGVSVAAPAAGVNILSAEPSPCGGSSGAIISGYYAAINVADYLKNI
jgi:hypothetical protein